MTKNLRRRLATLAAATAAAALLLTTNTAVALPAATGTHGAQLAGAATLAGPTAEPNIPPCPDPPIVGRGTGPALPNSDNPCAPPPGPVCTAGFEGPQDALGEIQFAGAVACTARVQRITVTASIYRRTSSGPRLFKSESKTVFNNTEAVVSAARDCVRGTHDYYGTVEATVDKPPVQTLPKVTSPEQTFTC
jgi:hypothetical protein